MRHNVFQTSKVRLFDQKSQKSIEQFVLNSRKKDERRMNTRYDQSFGSSVFSNHCVSTPCITHNNIKLVKLVKDLCNLWYLSVDY